MNESFLYYVWQFQYFDKKELRTTDDELIEVFQPGILNHHAGPDFSNARIGLQSIAWAGNIEIHTKSSDWLLHAHDRDPAYENVILHVVWQNDKRVLRSDGSPMPTLELDGLIPENLIRDYTKLVHNPFQIPCTKSFPDIDNLTKISMLDRAVMQRLDKKAADVMVLLRQNRNDWEETAYQVLAANFGFKINQDPFLQLAKSLPYKYIRKHADKPVQIEAMLFGQAGFLDIEIGDEYYQLLRREYILLAGKYGLGGSGVARAQWRFLRLRPANFPTVRIAQFSALLCVHQSLFSFMLEARDYKSLIDFFSVTQSAYWLQHYRFNKKSKGTVPEPGLTSLQNILMNSVAPLWVAYGKVNGDQDLIERAAAILDFVPAENNNITRAWRELGYTARTSFDSQGLIELYNSFCQKRNCLNCNIGASILKPKS